MFRLLGYATAKLSGKTNHTDAYHILIWAERVLKSRCTTFRLVLIFSDVLAVLAKSHRLVFGQVLLGYEVR